ncbi:MAG: Hpt domain-containing protein [Thermodesulfobacteriota bacterium]
MSISTNRPDVILDFDRLMSNCHNNLDIARELIEHLLDKSGPKWIGAMHKAAEADDSRALRETCHAMKGSAATIFAWRISNLGLKYEEMAKQGLNAEVIGDLKNLEREFDALRNWAADHI